MGRPHTRRLDAIEARIAGGEVPWSKTSSAVTTGRPRWSAKDASAWLRAFRRLVEARTDAFVASIVSEIGKPAHEALTSDVLPLLAACRWHERCAAGILAPGRLRGRPLWLLGGAVGQHRAPLGRVAIIATWNFPVQLLGVQLVQAIVAGNDVVVKPSEHAPRTQELLLETAREAGLSDRRLSWVDPTREAGQALLLTERFDHIVFTGSTEVGREIAEIAAQTLTPTTLELSGHDSAIVLDDANVALAAARLWQAVTLNAGQTCMAPRRILVERGAYDAFVAALAPLAAAARPLRLVSTASAARCFELCVAAVGAGGRSASALLEAPLGRELRPLAIVDCPRDAALFDGDHFGPVVAVMPVRDVIDALQMHHRGGQHLATSVFTRRPHRARELHAILGSSIVTVNDAVLPSGHPALAIGGRGESGWGVTRGHEGLLAMTRPVAIATSGRWLRVPTESPNDAQVRGLRRLSRWLYGR